MFIRITSIVFTFALGFSFSAVMAQEDLIPSFPKNLFSNQQHDSFSEHVKIEFLHSYVISQLQGDQSSEQLFTPEQAMRLIAQREKIMNEYAYRRITNPDEELDRIYKSQNELSKILIEELKEDLKDDWIRVEMVLNRSQVLMSLGDLLDSNRPDFGQIADNPLAWLSNEKLAEAIDLSEQQKKIIEQLLSRGRNEVLQQFEDKDDQVEKKRSSKEAAIWKILSREQSSKLRKWRGESANVKTFMSLPEVSQQFNEGGISNNDVIVTSSTVIDRDEQDESKVEFDNSLFFLLRNGNSPRILELTESQQKQIGNLLDNKYVTVRLKNNNLKRLLSLLDDQWNIPEWLDSLLLPHQQKWLQELEFQVFTLAERDSLGVLNRDVAQALGLTQNQQTEITNIVDQFLREQANFESEFKSGLKNTYDKIFEEIYEILTAKQQKTMVKWFGNVR